MRHESADRDNESTANDFAESFLFPWTTENRSRLVDAIVRSSDIESLLNIQADWGVDAEALLIAAAARNIRGTNPKSLQLKEHRLRAGSEVFRLEETNVLPDAANDFEDQHFGRPIGSLAKEEGFPLDMVNMMVMRAPAARPLGGNS